MKQVEKDDEEKEKFFNHIIRNQHYCPWHKKKIDDLESKYNKKFDDFSEKTQLRIKNKACKYFKLKYDDVAFIVQPIDDIDTTSIEIVLEKTKTDEFIKKLNSWLKKVDNNLTIKTEAHKDKIKQKKEKQAQKKAQIKKAKKDLKDLFLKKRRFFW